MLSIIIIYSTTNCKSGVRPPNRQILSKEGWLNEHIFQVKAIGHPARGSIGYKKRLAQSEKDAVAQAVKKSRKQLISDELLSGCFKKRKEAIRCQADLAPCLEVEKSLKVCFDAKKACQNVSRERAISEQIDWNRCVNTLSRCEDVKRPEDKCQALHQQCDQSYPLSARCRNVFRLMSFIRDGRIVKKDFQADDSCHVIYQVHGEKIRTLHDATLENFKARPVDNSPPVEKSLPEEPVKTIENMNDPFRDDIDQTP